MHRPSSDLHYGRTMPDPLSLRIGDLVRFVSILDEWSHPGIRIPRESMLFMNEMIQRTWPSRISRIDESGYPWIEARIRQRGRIHYHAWLITESTGWRRVNRSI